MVLDRNIGASQVLRSFYSLLVSRLPASINSSTISRFFLDRILGTVSSAYLIFPDSWIRRSYNSPAISPIGELAP
jgi:hypothetical protein